MFISSCLNGNALFGLLVCRTCPRGVSLTSCGDTAVVPLVSPCVSLLSCLFLLTSFFKCSYFLFPSHLYDMTSCCKNKTFISMSAKKMQKKCM